MKKHDLIFILKCFLTWRVLITIIAFLAIKYVPIFGVNFFGGKYVNYVTNPLFWGWANFDGEHYSSIALYGYKSLQQFFFPVYPYLIKLVSNLIGNDLISYVWSGIIVSNLAFLIGLYGFYKLARLDYSEKVSKLATILILTFPTSFYFGAVYSESIFLCFTVWAFYLFRTNKYLLASILGMIASGTRVVGITLLPAFFTNIFIYKDLVKTKIISFLLIPLGLVSYMYYIFLNWGGSLKLYQAYALFGEQRSSHIVLLHQVFYRYLVKIIPNLDFNYLPSVFTVFIEFLAGVIFLYLLIISFNKIRWDYWVYSVLGYLIPTFSGSFSSMPRYVILLFPMFFILSQKLISLKKPLLIGIFVFMFIILTIAESLFFRGYFVS